MDNLIHGTMQVRQYLRLLILKQNEMEHLITTFLGVAFLFFLCKKAGDKRRKITKRCPKCGTLCHASRWSTGLQHQDGSYVHSFTCPNCGNKFYD